MFKKKLTQIVSSFSKTLVELEVLVNQNSALVETNIAEINRRSDENSVLVKESEQAQRIAEKLRKILE